MPGALPCCDNDVGDARNMVYILHEGVMSGIQKTSISSSDTSYSFLPADINNHNYTT
jgi:hypothetical protein